MIKFCTVLITVGELNDGKGMNWLNWIPSEKLNIFRQLLHAVLYIMQMCVLLYVPMISTYQMGLFPSK